MSYAGKLLRVDLSSGKVSTENLSASLLNGYLGGRGLASKMLYDEIDPAVDALSPQNKLILTTGPLTGSAMPGGSRYMVVAKSPLTNTISCSNSGGYFGPELKYAGYDLIIFEGRAEKPAYLFIKNDHAEIRDAGHLWGKSVAETEDTLLNETIPGAKISSIGPAGEKLVRFAAVMNDKHRAAGRNGVGAVMGSKNLKAVVVKGTGSLKVADPKTMREVALRSLATIKANPMTPMFAAYGTTMAVDVKNSLGQFPTRNHQQTIFEGANKINSAAVNDSVLVRNKACFGCPVACSRVTRVNTPQYAGSGEGPEYETIWAFGAACGVDNIEAITKANYICNEMGMDTISAGATIACAMELAECGYIPQDVLGREVRFGDADAMIELLQKTVSREGFGDILAEGSYRMAQEYGHPELAMAVKMQELPAHGSRGAKGQGLAYATSNRGACHLRGPMFYIESFGMFDQLSPLSTDKKAPWLKILQDQVGVTDSMGLCLFVSHTPEDVYGAFVASTGSKLTPEALNTIGERIYNLERVFNMKAGLTGADDTLPPRLTSEPVPEGPAKGQVVELDQMLPEYYKVRGWDDQGVPTPEKLQQLGIA